MTKNRTPDASPSYQRRQALRDADAGNVATVDKSSSYPLEKYFQITDRLLLQFQQALEERKMDETYVYGIRFASFCLEQLPKHPQYNQRQFQKAKTRNARQVEKVLKTMEILTKRMDAEELVKQKKEREEREERERIQREKEEQERLDREEELERQRQQRELDRQNEQERQQQTRLERQKSKKMQQQQIENSAYAKLQTMKEEQGKLEQSAYAKLQTMRKKQSKSQPKQASPVQNNKKVRPKPKKMSSKPEVAVESQRMQKKQNKPQSKQANPVQNYTDVQPIPTKKSSKSNLVEQVEPKKTQEASKPPPKPQKAPSKNTIVEPPVKPESTKIASPKPNKKESKKPKQSDPAPNSMRIQPIPKKMSSKPNVVEPVAPKKTQGASKPIPPTPQESLSKKKVGEQHIEPEATEVIHSTIKPKPDVFIKSSPQPQKRKPKTEEEKTIVILEAAIAKQEERLFYIDNVAIPTLLKEAKAHLSKNDKHSRKAALRCLAHKKRLEGDQDTIKSSIFNMETQIFMLENVMGDRQVKEALDSAAEAMESIQASVGGVDAVQLQTGLMELSGQSVASSTTYIEMEFDEHELEQELEQWTSSGSTVDAEIPSPSKAGVSKSNESDEDISILSMPKIPKEETGKSSRDRKKVGKATPIQRLMKPVI